MRRINKATEPKELSDFNKQTHSEWDEIHTDENQHVYEACILQCMQDQMNLCGYTELCLDNGLRHIDHYVKRAIDSRLTFDWNNMIAAVKDSRFGADYKDEMVTSDDYNLLTKQYKHIYNPLVDDLKDKFCFDTNGFMSPIDPQDTKAEKTIEVFNLNEPSLQAYRRDCMGYVRSMRQGEMSDEDIRETLIGGGFISAIEYELSQEVLR